MNVNTIEQRLQQNVKKEIEEDVNQFIDLLEKKYGNMYNSHKSIDIAPYVCSYVDVKGEKKSEFSLGERQLSLKCILKEILVKSYEDKLLKHKVDKLLQKLEILD